jgi:transcriptional antiterminator RfaH
MSSFLFLRLVSVKQHVRQSYIFCEYMTLLADRTPSSTESSTNVQSYAVLFLFEICVVIILNSDYHLSCNSVINPSLKDIMSTKQTWFVVQTKLRKENMVYDQLCAKSIEAYYPTLLVNPVNPRASKIRPFLPEYLFVRVDLEKIAMETIKWLHGVKQLVERDDEPVSIPDSIIKELKQQIVVINETCSLDIEYLKQGSLVQLTDGPLAGHDLLFDMRLSGTERVQVLLEIAGWGAHQQSSEML